jgi:hypothetical protein
MSQAQAAFVVVVLGIIWAWQTLFIFGIARAYNNWLYDWNDTAVAVLALLTWPFSLIWGWVNVKKFDIWVRMVVLTLSIIGIFYIGITYMARSSPSILSR